MHSRSHGTKKLSSSSNSRSHVSVRCGDDPQQKIRCMLPLNSSTIRANSRPVTIHLLSAVGFSASPTAPPSSLTPAFTCSWPRSSAIEEKHFFVFWTTNEPLQNCVCTSGCFPGSSRLGSVQRAIWRSWHDAVQRTMVKSALWLWHTWKSLLLSKLSHGEDNRVANLVHQPSTKTGCGHLKCPPCSS